MSSAPRRAPRSDADWARSVEKRLRTTASKLSVRIGSWAINEVDGQLVATKPGEATLEVGKLPDPVVVDLSARGSFVTEEQVADAVTGGAGSTFTSVTTWLSGKWAELTTAGTNASTGLGNWTALLSGLPGAASIADISTRIQESKQRFEDIVSGFSAPNFGSVITDWLATRSTATTAGSNATTALGSIAAFWDGSHLVPDKVGGYGGFADFIETLQATWDFVWPGGSGRSLADVANFATDTVNTINAAADLVDSNAQILAIRNNRPLYHSMDPTAESTFALDKLMGGSIPTFGVTQSTAAMGFMRILQSAVKGSISWWGGGITNISTAYLTVYKMDTATGDLTKVLESPDISYLMSATAQWNNYDIPEADRFSVLPGEVYGVELKVRGAGTHTIAGIVNNFADHSVWPSKIGAQRNSGTGASPSTIAAGSVGYHANTAWFGLGIADGDIEPPVYTPRTATFTASGSYLVPEWAVYLDIIVMGGGQGGSDGLGFAIGPGGNNGNWATATVQRGVTLPTSTASLTVVVGGGGSRSTFSVSGGDNGSNSSVSGTGMTTVTATGGSGGNAPSSSGEGGDHRTYNDVTYVQGAVRSGPNGGNGNAPGGGGSGGGPGALQQGGDGARGQVWIVARVS